MRSRTGATSRGRTLAQIEAYLGIPAKTLKIVLKPASPTTHRYVWRLAWDRKQKPLLVVGLIASTADKMHADPTVWKCIQIAKENGYGELIVVNLFAAWPTPNHRRAWPTSDLVGSENDRHIREQANYVRDAGGDIVVAWGADGWSRQEHALSLLGGEVLCFGTTRDGTFPLHASLRATAAEDTSLQPFNVTPSP